MTFVEFYLNGNYFLNLGIQIGPKKLMKNVLSKIS